MRIGEAFPSNFIKAADLPPDRYVRVSIAHVTYENVALEGKPQEMKMVCHFNGKSKGLILNKTNAQMIATGYGDETDNWRGREVLLYVAEVMFQGKPTPAVRVKIPATPAPAQPPIQHAPARADNGGVATHPMRPPAPAQPPSDPFEGETEAEFNESEIPF